MAKDNKELSETLATRQPEGKASAPVVFEQNVGAWFKRNAKRMVTLAGDKDTANKFIVTLLHVASTNPRLLECNMDTIGECLMHSAALNLYPGPMQQCAYVPFKGKATFIPMYQGLVSLAYKSGFVRSINSGVVRDGDAFEYVKGSDPYLKHVEGHERGEITHAWAVIKMLKGDPVIEVMQKEAIDAIMKRSPAASRNDSPWHTDYEPMARKTVLRRGLKVIPKSSELADALQLDNAMGPIGVPQPVVTINPANVLEIDAEPAVETPSS